MVRALAFSYNHKLKVLTTISAIKFGLAVSNSIDAYSLSCAHCAASAKNIFILRKRICRIGRFLRRRTGLPPLPFAAQTTLKILTELLCKPLSGRAPTMNKEFFVPRKGQNQDYGYLPPKGSRMQAPEFLPTITHSNQYLQPWDTSQLSIRLN